MNIINLDDFTIVDKRWITADEYAEKLLKDDSDFTLVELHRKDGDTSWKKRGNIYGGFEKYRNDVVDSFCEKCDIVGVLTCQSDLKLWEICESEELEIDDIRNEKIKDAAMEMEKLIDYETICTVDSNYNVEAYNVRKYSYDTHNYMLAYSLENYDVKEDEGVAIKK